MTQGAWGGLCPGYFKQVISELFFLATCLLFPRYNLYSGGARDDRRGSNSGGPSADPEKLPAQKYTCSGKLAAMAPGCILEGEVGVLVCGVHLSRTVAPWSKVT